MPRRFVTAVVAAGLLAALPAPAMAQSKLFQDYRKDGIINPCAYSPGQLQQGLKDLPPDVQQYVPGLGDQLRRSCPQGASPALQAQQQIAIPLFGGGGGPPAPQVVIAKPPAPKAPQPKRLAGVAPTVAQGPIPDIPGWVAALLAAVLVGGVAALLGVRYGALSLGGFGRRLKGSSVTLGERVGDGFAAIGDRLRFR
jgi:hypothetical protein